jgi:curved DNA-binding protein CbpA
MKDYYRILGVHFDADDIVIRAAYKALTQKYHPDKWQEDKAEANRRMQDLNEAYDTLSDLSARLKYNQQYSHFINEISSPKSVFFSAGIGEKYTNAWNEACENYPKLVEEFKELGKISVNLANRFRDELISSKDFGNSLEYKNNLENQYLRKFFGDVKEDQELGKSLLVNNYKKPAVELAIYLMQKEFSISVDYDYAKSQYTFTHEDGRFRLLETDYLNFISEHLGLTNS